jgi:hypothetical protein
MAELLHIPTNQEVREILCIDVGGTVTDASGRYKGGPWLDNPDTYLQTPLQDGFQEALGELIDARFDRNAIFFVSKCDELTEARTREYMEVHGMHEQFGVPRGNFRFTRTRDKSQAVREIGGTHMVDDRLEVLKGLIGVARYLHHINPDPAEAARFADAVPHVIPSIGWRATAAAILRTPRILAP